MLTVPLPCCLKPSISRSLGLSLDPDDRRRAARTLSDEPGRHLSDLDGAGGAGHGAWRLCALSARRPARLQIAAVQLFRCNDVSGDAAGIPTCLRPLNAYARSKVAGETVCDCFARTGPMHATWPGPAGGRGATGCLRRLQRHRRQQCARPRQRRAGALLLPPDRAPGQARRLQFSDELRQGRRRVRIRPGFRPKPLAVARLAPRRLRPCDVAFDSGDVAQSSRKKAGRGLDETADFASGFTLAGPLSASAHASRHLVFEKTEGMRHGRP